MKKHIADALIFIFVLAVTPYFLGFMAKCFWKAFMWGWTLI